MRRALPAANPWWPRATAALLGWPLVAVLLAAGCAPRVSVTLPSGSSRVEPLAAQRFREATTRCGRIASWSAEMSLAGRVRGSGVRGRILAGSRQGGDLRLEGLAPFGAPVFILVSDDESSSLLLPREARVLRSARAAEVLDALIGVRLSAADLAAVLTGCVAAARDVSDPRAFDAGWLAVSLGEDADAYLREASGTWRVEGARLGPVSVAYGNFAGAAPQEIRLVAGDRTSATAVQIRLRLSQVEENPPLGDDAFEVTVPPDADPLTLDDLRRRGLRGSGS